MDFEIQPNNFLDGPWKPILTEKPHATVPLDESLVTFVRNDGAVQYVSHAFHLPSSDFETNKGFSFRYKHPYEHEISSMQYPDRVFQIQDPIPPQPAETTSATWVDTYEGVLAMLEELKGAKEIAVDLEHHDFRTYIGLVSLLQISTREKDWVVDTLKPWRHKLQVLNEVFADPTIIKVRALSSKFSTCCSQFQGLSWRIYGYGLASERSRPLCQRPLRHIFRQRCLTLFESKFSISPFKIRQF